MLFADFSFNPFPDSLALVAAVFMLAGMVKGVVGLGLPTISMALLALFMPPASAAALLIVPSLLTNVWQTRPWPALMPMLKRLGTMQLGVIVGTLAGALIFGAPAGSWASVSLGVALIAYGFWGLFGRPLTIAARNEKWLGPLVGILTGMVTAVTGVFVVPAVPYLQALGLGKNDLIQAMGISFTVSTIALAAGLGINASYSTDAAISSLAMLIPALVGMMVGQALRQSLSPKVFRVCFLGSLALLGAYQVIKEIVI